MISRMIVLLLPLLAGSPPVFAGAAEAARGRELYEDYCKSCHGPEAAGLSAFTGNLAAFRQRLVGTDNMPDMSGVLTEAQAAELFAFLESRRSH